jgi:hypothetical protein
MSPQMRPFSQVTERESRRWMPVRRAWPNEDQEACDPLCACATPHVQVKIQLRRTWGGEAVLMMVWLEHGNMVREMVRWLEEVSGSPTSPKW